MRYESWHATSIIGIREPRLKIVDACSPSGGSLVEEFLAAGPAREGGHARSLTYAAANNPRPLFLPEL